MIEPHPQWRRITTRRDARALSAFTCTTEFPRTPGGRRLPHDRPWEWEVQRHLRQTSQHLRNDELVLVGMQGDEIIAAARLQFESVDDILQVFVAAIGVALPWRHQGGGLADRTLAKIHAEGAARATDVGCAHLVLTGKTHWNNTASQRMLQRAGWEPYGSPTGDYQLWGLILQI